MAFNEAEVHERLLLFQSVFLKVETAIDSASTPIGAREDLLELARDCIASNIEKGETDPATLLAAVKRDVLESQTSQKSGAKNPART